MARGGLDRALDGGTWPAPGTTTSRAPGIAAAMRRAPSGGVSVVLLADDDQGREARPASGSSAGAVVPVAHGGQGADHPGDRRGRHDPADPLRRSRARAPGWPARGPSGSIASATAVGAALPGGRRRRVARPPGLRRRRLRPGCRPGSAPRTRSRQRRRNSKSDVAAHREPAEHHLVHAQRVEQRREVIGVDRHAVAQVGRVGLAHAAQIGRDAAVAVQRVDLVAPDRAVEADSRGRRGWPGPRPAPRRRGSRRSP